MHKRARIALSFCRLLFFSLPFSGFVHFPCVEYFANYLADYFSFPNSIRNQFFVEDRLAETVGFMFLK